ncbi:MAG: KH domain-containing protein [Lentisphaeria bacterium]|nr:KH domain-containing protein [Lentisphaeria bacterium]
MPITQEQSEQSVDIFSEMVRLLGIQASASAVNGEDRTWISVKSEEAGRLIGRKGQYLESLELLLNRILRRKFGKCGWVELEIDGYQKRRPTGPDGRRSKVDEEKLTRIANDTAKEVKRWEKSARIGPFNASERRVIHMVLRDDPKLETESEEADADGKKMVIVRLGGGEG